MKTLMTILSLFLLISCSKSKDAVAPVDSGNNSFTYVLNFQMENDHDGVYRIQRSTDNLNFTTIDSLRYSLSNNGIYNREIVMKKGTYLRVVEIDSSNTTVTSDVVIAND